VEHLEAVQQRRERQHLGDEHPLPAAVGPAFGEAAQPPSVGGEQMRAVLRPGDQIAVVGVRLDAVVDAAVGQAFVADQLAPGRPELACRLLGVHRDRQRAPGW
jgi:hypothetical protein